MILSGNEILNRLGEDISIQPFERGQLNPNSYNLRLHNELVVYTDNYLDMKASPKIRNIEIPDDGVFLYPGELYLGRTVEYTQTLNHVPMLEGRSSIGRLGMFIHVTAGFGDVGFEGYWTLEISVLKPIRIYPNVEICQIYYHTIEGEVSRYQSGKYQRNNGIQASMLYKEFE